MVVGRQEPLHIGDSRLRLQSWREVVDEQSVALIVAQILVVADELLTSKTWSESCLKTARYAW